MKNIIQAMEQLGKHGSINQYDSVEEMLSSLNMDLRVVDSTKLLSRDLICSMSPDDEK